MGNWEQAGWVAALLQGILGIKWRANRVTGSCRLEGLWWLSCWTCCHCIRLLKALLIVFWVSPGMEIPQPQPDYSAYLPSCWEFFLISSWNFLCSNLCLLPFVLSALLRRVALSSLHQYIVVGSNNISHRLFSPRWPNPTVSVSPWPSCALAPWLPWWLSY